MALGSGIQREECYLAPMERAVEIFAVIHLGITGLSHILAPRAWIDFFVGLREQGHPGVFAVGFMSLFIGSVIAAFYNVWSGHGLVLTLYGWTLVLKGALYLILPSYGMRGLRRIDAEKPYHLAVPGVGLLVLAGVVVYGWL